MAFITYRTSRGKKYWSIVESVRVDGKPKHRIIEYLGTAETLLERLQNKGKVSLKSYSHGDTTALFNVAKELKIKEIIDKHVTKNKNNKGPKRDNISTGTTFVLGAIGRACCPTSKRGWYEWCKTTSMEYCLKSSFKKMDSQHFWDQMSFIPEDKIQTIEEEIIEMLVKNQGINLDTLLFDTSNFFTFISSENTRCDIAKRGKNKQKRNDLRQFGLALLVTRKEQFPLFHKTYEGNNHDSSVFKSILKDMLQRLRKLSKQVTDITLVFDKGNNSKENFARLDAEKDIYYVAGLVPSHFKSLIKEANKNFELIKIDGEEIPAYRIKKNIWGDNRTCVMTVSKQLKEGQTRGILQHLEKKYKELEAFKKQLENSKGRKKFTQKEITTRLAKIIKGQFIEDILKYDFIKLKDRKVSFTYYIDNESFSKLKKEILGRKIFVTNRHDWSSEEIIQAYRGQAKVEYAFRNLKNPYHMCIRPQFHWTDQKIRAHVLMCVISYLLTVAAYAKARGVAGYKRNINNFLKDLKKIRMICGIRKKGRKVTFQLETIPKGLVKAAKVLGITQANFKLAL